MCGLAGFIGYQQGARLAEQASRIQQHRGPDHQGSWSDDYLSLAHQRLSIIDLSERSNQPMVKNELVIVFNGEIYNYALLREQLVAAQVAMLTSSDTEVVLEMYRLHGAQCLQHFIGMFAFAIYDMSSRELFLARDHFGIKPLFYTAVAGRFAFASELKTLVETGCAGRDIDYRSLVGAINYLWVPGNGTMFRDCHKLPPGHYLRLPAGGTPALVHWWRPELQVETMSDAEAHQCLHDTLYRSIQRHMVADVPVSSFLSGGLDSSLISVLARRHATGLSTYTIATTASDKRVEQMPEDEAYAREVATLHGFSHHELVISPDIVQLLPRMVRALDEPIGDPAAINTFLICEAARADGVKVLLSGMGADELLFGYRRQHATLLAMRYQRLPRLLRAMVRAVISRLPVKLGGRGLRLVRWARRFLEFAELPVDAAYMRSYSYYSPQELAALFGGRFSDEIAALQREHHALFTSAYAGDPVNQMCHTDIHMFMLGLNETYTDRASMAASVEVRVPFIDREVVQCAMRLQARHKYRRRSGKYLLRKVAEAYLPRRIVHRPKAAFGAPLRAWISGPLRAMVDDLLSPESVQRRGLMDYAVIRRMIEEDRRGEADHAYRIYQLLTLELWFREFVDSGVPG